MEPLVVLLAKATVLFMLALVSAFGLRRKAAVLPHALLTTAFVAVLALPFLSGRLPTVPLPMLQSRFSTTPVPLAYGDDVGFESVIAEPLSSPRHISTPAPVERAATERSPRAWLFLVWLVGAASLLTALLIAHLRAWMLTRQATPLYVGDWPASLESMKRRVGVSTQVRLVTSAHVSVPMTAGILRPVVVLPQGASAWDEARREVVLAHELVHVTSRDPIRLLLARVTCVAYWFHPLAWLTGWTSRTVAERACDEAVVALGLSRSAYAQALLSFATLPPEATNTALVPMARGSNFEQRLAHILAVCVPPARRRTKRAVLALSTLLAVGVAAMQPISASRRTATDVVRTVGLPDSAPAIAGPARTPRTFTRVSAPPQSPTAPAPTPALASLRGRVINGVTGEGLAGARLLLRCNGASFYGLERVADTQGEFAIDNLGTDRCLVNLVSLQGFSRDFAEARYLETSADLYTVRLWPLGSLAGRLLDSSGAPLTGAPLDLLVSPTIGTSTDWVETTLTASTDRDGRFRFGNLTTGRQYRLAARSVDASTEVDLPHGQSRNDVELRGRPRETFRVTGRVMQDVLWPGALAVRLHSTDGRLVIGPVRPDDNGRFVLTTVPAGTYHLRARPAMAPSPRSPAPTFARQVVVDADVDGVELVAEPTRTIHGVLRYEGSAAGGRSGLLGLDRIDAPAGTSPSRMVEIGGPEFWVEGLVSGRYRFRASGVPTGYAVTRVTANGADVTVDGFDPFAIDGGVTVTLSNDLATITGRIRTRTGDEASEASVVVFAAASSGPSRYRATVQATQRGQYQVLNLPPGEYLLAAIPTASLPHHPLTLPAAFDPVLASRLLPLATRVTARAREATTADVMEVDVAPR